MKVAHVYWGLTYGGIETMLVNIANAQAKEGAQIYVVLVNDMVEEALLRSFDPTIHIYRLGRKKNSKGLGFVFRLNRTLEKIAPDAVHLHGSIFYGMIFSKKLSHEASVTLHALPRGSVRHEGWLYRLFPRLNITIKNAVSNVPFMDKVPKVFAISRAVKDALKEKYGIDSVVVNNGIVTSGFRQREEKMHGVPLRIVQVSRLEHDKKGQDLMIRAAAMLKGRMAIDFIGDGSSREYLERMTDELGVRGQVRFLGMQPQSYIAGHLCDYDLFVQPSRWEGFGLTVAEAMAARVPVLVSAGQGPAEVTCGDRYGWLFENGNVEDLARQIEYINGHYDEALCKAGNALSYVREAYDVSVTARKYLQLYW